MLAETELLTKERFEIITINAEAKDRSKQLEDNKYGEQKNAIDGKLMS